MNLALMFIYTYAYNIILYVYLAFFIFANISFSSVRINVVNVSHVHKSWGLVELIFLNMKWIMVFSSTFRRKKSRAIVVTPASASASGSVKFFVRVHYIWSKMGTSHQQHLQQSKFYHRLPQEKSEYCQQISQRKSLSVISETILRIL
jgi:hypothetical protein